MLSQYLLIKGEFNLRRNTKFLVHFYQGDATNLKSPFRTSDEKQVGIIFKNCLVNIIFMPGHSVGGYYDGNKKSTKACPEKGKNGPNKEGKGSLIYQENV